MRQAESVSVGNPSSRPASPRTKIAKIKTDLDLRLVSSFSAAASLPSSAATAAMALVAAALVAAGLPRRGVGTLEGKYVWKGFLQGGGLSLSDDVGEHCSCHPVKSSLHPH